MLSFHALWLALVFPFAFKILRPRFATLLRHTVPFTTEVTQSQSYFSAWLGAMRMKRDEKESSGQEGTNYSTDAQKRLKLKCNDGGSSDSLKQLASCKDIPGGNVSWLESERPRGLVTFEVTGALPNSSFCSFIEENSEEDVVGFFREIAREMEDKRGVLEFHLKVIEKKQWFQVQVYFGDDEKNRLEEAAESGECISCFPGAALFPGQEPGVTAGECVLAEFSDQPHVHCSLDAIARAGFVITPVRHVERMSQLQDDELFALWSTAVRALRQDSLPFWTMILNHGTYRIAPHLRLKVWVDDMLHEQVRSKWSSVKLDLWDRLLAMAKIIPKRPCRFFQRTGRCRYGEQCRFSHTQQNSVV